MKQLYMMILKKNRKEFIMENETKGSASAPETEEELNEDSVPRPKKDPLNWLYTLISLAIFAVGYFGVDYIKSNLFLPYSQTASVFTTETEALLIAETETPLPTGGAFISSARLSSGTDSDLLHVWYKDIGDTEKFADLLGFEYGDVLTSQRCAVFRDESFDETYVFADIYVSVDDPGLSCLVYEYEGSSYAEFRKSVSSSDVKSVFAGCPKVKLHPEKRNVRPE